MSNGSGGPLNDPAILFFLTIAAIAGVGWAIWFVFHEQFLAMLRYVRLAELAVIDLVTLGAYNDVIKALLPSWLGGPQDPAMAQFTQEKFDITTNIVGRFFRWPAAALLAGGGFYAMFFNKKNKFKQRFDLEGLIQVQSEIWPVIKPIVTFNPGKSSARSLGDDVPEKLPMFAEALSPEEWLAFHGIAVTDNLPEREAVRKALIAQLGVRWRGPDALPPYARALYAAFALKGIQKRNESDNMVGEIAMCWTDKTGFSLTPALAKEVDRIIADPEIGGKATEIANQHAYSTTALLGVLRWARHMGGVLAPATFVWLRGLDRPLWYPMNNLGRRSYHSEAAGAMAHFMAETAAKKPLPIPRVDTALVIINQYLANNQVTIPRKVAVRKKEEKA